MSEGTLNMQLQVPLVNVLVRKKDSGRIGPRLRSTGRIRIRSNYSKGSLLEWYRSLGYGITENFNYSYITKPGDAGYVGSSTYDDVQCRIAEDGEIQVSTPTKMMGYYKNADATKETFTDDGWVRTGDKGKSR